MDRDIPFSKLQGTSSGSVEALQLPEIPECLQAALVRGHTLQIEGTNVVRVPFGIRRPRRQRPERANHNVTLVLPLQPQGSPTPPPQAA